MAEVARLGAELLVFYRAYPSNIGRLLSYESELGRVLCVEERDLSLGETDSVKVIISGGSNQGYTPNTRHTRPDPHYRGGPLNASTSNYFQFLTTLALLPIVQ